MFQIGEIPSNFGLLVAFEEALELEKDVYEKLLKMHDVGPNDPEVCDVINLLLV